MGFLVVEEIVPDVDSQHMRLPRQPAGVVADYARAMEEIAIVGDGGIVGGGQVLGESGLVVSEDGDPDGFERCQDLGAVAWVGWG